MKAVELTPYQELARLQEDELKRNPQRHPAVRAFAASQGRQLA